MQNVGFSGTFLIEDSGGRTVSNDPSLDVQIVHPPPTSTVRVGVVFSKVFVEGSVYVALKHTSDLRLGNAPHNQSSVRVHQQLVQGCVKAM